MPLENVHQYEMDRATSRLELRSVNPKRTYIEVKLHEDGHWAGTPAYWSWQGGKWYDSGEREVPESEVPLNIREQLAANPVVVTTHGPAVTWTCPRCGEPMNQSEQERHLLAHIDTVVRAAGTSDIPPPVTKKTDANTHGRS